MQQHNYRMPGQRAGTAVSIVAIFAAVWMLFYNRFMFDNYIYFGAAVVIAIYVLIYSLLGRLYQAFEIGIFQVGEIVFSQGISFGIADAIIYLQCCLVYNNYIDIRPGLAAYAVQLVVCWVWAWGSKRYFVRHIQPRDTIVIYGNNDNYQAFITKLSAYRHLFTIKDQLYQAQLLIHGLEYLSDYDAVILYDIDSSVQGDILNYCVSRKQDIYLSPSVESVLLLRADRRHYIDTPLLGYDYYQYDLKEPASKRLFDVCFSLLSLILFAPLMLLTAVLIKLEDGGSVFFKQARCTKKGKTFYMIKFRSMIEDAEKNGQVIPCTTGDDRVTRCGRVIRRYRIDELPQFINILKGEMSVVGPRPERVEHVKKYTKNLSEFTYRHNAKAGLTGYAQVYGKYNTSHKDKLLLDLMYIKDRSVLTDLKVILLTLKTIIYNNGTDGFAETPEEDHSKVS